MEWIEKLSAAIDYIEDNLDKTIVYEDIANIAGCSTFYFQRIFTYVSGVSLSEYIRRRRMTQAAFDLQKTRGKVIDIALKYGYNSPTSFNRAFQKVHGITPVAAKSVGITLNAYPSIKFSVKVSGGSALTYHITDKPSMRIVGVRNPLVQTVEENFKVIPDFWKAIVNSTIFSDICNLSDQYSNSILGISVHENAENRFYYIAVPTTLPVPTGMFEYTLPVATWVVFENNGYFKEKVQTIFKRFFTEWLPLSGYEYAGLPDIELYPILQTNPACGHSEVWFAITQNKEF